MASSEVGFKTCKYCHNEVTETINGKCLDCRIGSKEKSVEVLKEVSDPVNHPKHYRSHPSGIECIEITRYMGFNLGNAIKYIWRADLKEASIQDLEKAIWYIKDEIELRKKI